MPISPTCSSLSSAVSLTLPPPPPPLCNASQESFALSEPSVSFAPDVRETVPLPPAPASSRLSPASPWHRLTTSIDRETLTILSRKASSGAGSTSLRVASSLGPLRSKSGLFSSSSSAADILAESDSEEGEDGGEDDEEDSDDVLIQQSDYIRMIADLRKTRESSAGRERVTSMASSAASSEGRRTQEEPLDDEEQEADAYANVVAEDADAEPLSSDLTEDDEPPSEQPRVLASERV